MSKYCTKCHTEQPISIFYHRTKPKVRLSAYCIPCENAYGRYWRNKNKDKVKQASAKYYNNNKEKHKDNMRRSLLNREYGITTEDYQQMLLRQKEKCGICKKTLTVKKHFDVDHCHATGKIRGLLCNQCNQALGLFKDNTTTLKAAIEYLTTNNNNGTATEQFNETY